ncbi:MAG TPA: ATP-binding protein [archaeon]|nr:ATP-binding protein [archaeon]
MPTAKRMAMRRAQKLKRIKKNRALMAKQVPWEIMEKSLKSYGHDHISAFQGLVNDLEFIESVPETEHIQKEIQRVAQNMYKSYVGNIDLILAEENPTEKQKLLERYGASVRLNQRDLREVQKEFEDLRSKHQDNPKLSKREKWAFGQESKGFDIYFKMFPASSIGTKLKPWIEEYRLHDHLSYYLQQPFVDRDGHPVKVIFRSTYEGPVNYDAGLLQRVIYNLISDALNHTPGRPIYVNLERKNGIALITVTNEGEKLTPVEIAKIGKVRFTRALHDPKRGWGKVSTRFLVESMGGRFYAGNSEIGPKLTIELPIAA